MKLIEQVSQVTKIIRGNTILNKQFMCPEVSAVVLEKPFSQRFVFVLAHQPLFGSLEQGVIFRVRSLKRYPFSLPLPLNRVRVQEPLRHTPIENFREYPLSRARDASGSIVVFMIMNVLGEFERGGCGRNGEQYMLQMETKILQAWVYFIG